MHRRAARFEQGPLIECAEGPRDSGRVVSDHLLREASPAIAAALRRCRTGARRCRP